MTDTDKCDQYQQVYKSCPQTLLPVLPHLESELRIEDTAKRVAAVQLLGSLFGQGGSDLDTSYTQLFGEFLRRFRDVSVRVARQRCSPEAYVLRHARLTNVHASSCSPRFVGRRCV